MPTPITTVNIHVHEDTNIFIRDVYGDPNDTHILKFTESVGIFFDNREVLQRTLTKLLESLREPV